MDHVAWVIVPLVLAGVLGSSAAAKAGRGSSLREIIANLRLPAWVLPGWLARAIPALELGLAVGLLAPWLPVFTVAAAGTLALVVAYWALIARGLTITPRPECGCFGRVGDHRISWRTLLRNTLLVAAAGAALGLASSGHTTWSLLSTASVGDWTWLALTTMACLVTGLVLAGARSEPPDEEAAGPPEAGEPPADDDYVRTPTPQLVLHDPTSGPVTLDELSAKRSQLLVFVNCYCVSTKEVMADIEGWHERIDPVDVRMVFSVPIAEQFVGSPPPRTLVDHRGLAWQALGLRRSPSAVLLGVDGFLAGGPVSGPVEVQEFVELVEETLRESAVTGPDGAAPGDRPAAQPSGDLRTADPATG